MKSRLGFVSNSSSSSFIIACDEGKEYLNIKIPFNKLDDYKVIKTEQGIVDYYNDYEGGVYIKDETTGKYNCVKANDINHLEQLLQIENEQYWIDRIKHLKNIVQSGKVVKMFSSSSEDYGIGAGLYYLGLPESDEYEIIQNGEC